MDGSHQKIQYEKEVKYQHPKSSNIHLHILSLQNLILKTAGKTTLLIALFMQTQ
mgnify:CR=1 FL=1